MCSQITTTVKILWKPSGFSGKVNNKNEKYIFALKLYINYFLKTFGPVLDKDMQSTQKELFLIQIVGERSETNEKRKKYIPIIFLSYDRFCSKFSSVLGPNQNR